MTDAYICRWLTFFIDKLIICQDIEKEHSLLNYLKNALTKSLFLPLSLLLINLGIQPLGPTYFFYTIW